MAVHGGRLERCGLVRRGAGRGRSCRACWPACRARTAGWLDAVIGHPALTASGVADPGPPAGIVADQDREPSPALAGSSVVSLGEHYRQPGTGVDVPHGHPARSILGGDEDRGWPGSLPFTNMRAVGGGYPDGRPLRHLVGFDCSNPGHRAVLPHPMPQPRRRVGASSAGAQVRQRRGRARAQGHGRRQHGLARLPRPRRSSGTRSEPGRPGAGRWCYAFGTPARGGRQPGSSNGSSTRHDPVAAGSHGRRAGHHLHGISPPACARLFPRWPTRIPAETGIAGRRLTWCSRGGV